MGIEKFAVGFLQLRFVARTLPGKQWDVGQELRGRIADAFREAGIVAPPSLVAAAAHPGRDRPPVHLDALVLAASVVVTLVVYLSVRPEPPPPTELVPAVPVPVVTEAPRSTTTTARPRDTTPTDEETLPPTSVPITTMSTTPTTSTTGITLLPATSTTRR